MMINDLCVSFLCTTSLPANTSTIFCYLFYLVAKSNVLGMSAIASDLKY